MPQNLAKVIQKRPDVMPSLSEGKLLPEECCKFEDALGSFFLLKHIPVGERVPTAVCCLQDPVMKQWVTGCGPAMQTWTWETFVKNFRTRWLPKGWKSTMKREILGMEQGVMTFEEYQNAVRAKNYMLSDSEYFVSEEQLRSTLDAHMNADLAEECESLELEQVEDFDDWVLQVITADERMRRQAKIVAKALAELNRTNAKRATPTSFASFANAAPPSRVGRSFAPTTVDHNKENIGLGESKPPKLTYKERTLLEAHKGCYRCRKFYAGHIAEGCTEWPKGGADYKPLTAEMANAAKAAWLKRGVKVNAIPTDFQEENIASGSGQGTTDSDDEGVVYYDVQQGVVAAAVNARSGVILGDDFDNDAEDSDSSSD